MCLLLSLSDLITSLKSEWKTHVFFLNYKKLDFYTSIRSISRNVYVIKAKRELLKNINPNNGNVAERNAKSMEFLFLENC